MGLPQNPGARLRSIRDSVAFMGLDRIAWELDCAIEHHEQGESTYAIRSARNAEQQLIGAREALSALGHSEAALHLFPLVMALIAWPDLPTSEIRRGR